MKHLPFLLSALMLAGVVQADTDKIILYPGYGDARNVLIEGRIQENRQDAQPGASDGRLHNLWRSSRQFFNDERQQQALNLSLENFNGQTRSDDEGYFRLEAPVSLSPGWHPVHAESGKARSTGRVLVVPPENSLGLISDLDDTVQISEVTSKPRLLANTFLKNAAQRQAVPGVAPLYARVAAANPHPGAAPLFYLSASPRQMHEAISDFLARNSFPPGILITKRVSDDSASDPLLDQFAYKTQKIEAILTRLPWVSFILVGDDGEKDPEIYDWVRQHYPQQVAAIWIRRVSPDPLRPRPAEQRDLAEVIADTSAPLLDLSEQALPRKSQKITP